MHIAYSLRQANSGRKKEPKPKLFGPDIFQWGRGLPRERVGAKKFDTSLETREIKLFGRDIPAFCRDIPGVPEKFKKKKSLCSISVPYSSITWNHALINGDRGLSPSFCQWQGGDVRNLVDRMQMLHSSMSALCETWLNLKAWQGM